MGNWSLIIHGTGQHHNQDPKDVDQMAPGLVGQLQEAGQNVTGSTLTYGGMTDILMHMPDGTVIPQ